MLTPLDIHNKEFKRVMRGYDADEVDEFLDEIIKDFGTLYKENMEIKEQLQKQQENLENYQEMEQTLQKTMVLAQKVGEDTKVNSEKEAELIIWEAKRKAEQIISGAYDQVMENTAKIEQLISFEKQYKIKLKNFLLTQMQIIEDNVLGSGSEKVFKENFLEESSRFDKFGAKEREMDAGMDGSRDD